MLKRFQKYLNLHGQMMAVLLVTILLVEILFLVPTVVLYPRTDLMSAILPAVLVDLANNNRQVAKAGPLRTSELLTKGAQMKAEDMAKRGYFAHRDPDGRDPWYWMEKVGYRFTHAGENLAINFFDSFDVTNAWMKSPTHRANIMKPEYTEIGIGIARGRYQGRESLFVVEFFGRPVNSLKASTEEGKTANIPSGQLAGVGLIFSSPGLMFDKILASPRTIASLVYMLLGLLITIAIVVAFFSKHDHRLTIIRNGIILLIVLGSLLAFNRYLATAHGQIVEKKTTDQFAEIAER